MPAHLTHVDTSDLYKQYRIKDPVQKLADRHANRVKRLQQRRLGSPPEDISLHSSALAHTQRLLRSYQELLATRNKTATTPACQCPSCDQVFDTPAGLRTHIGRMHPGTVDKHIPVLKIISFQDLVRNQRNSASWIAHRTSSRARERAPPFALGSNSSIARTTRAPPWPLMHPGTVDKYIPVLKIISLQDLVRNQRNSASWIAHRTSSRARERAPPFALGSNSSMARTTRAPPWPLGARSSQRNLR